MHPGLATHTLLQQQIYRTIAEICRTLLGLGLDELSHEVDRVLRPATGEQAQLPAFFLHSTTPELKTFDGDLDAIVRGKTPGDFTTYKETRSVYLARPGDIVIGRTQTWKSAVRAIGVEAIELPDIDHYYLSHALLNLAIKRRHESVAALTALVAELRRQPRVIRLYAFEREMQIFLLWLARQAELELLPVEANLPAVAATWNRKSVLHPTVVAARDLEPRLVGLGADAVSEILELEAQSSHLGREMGRGVPMLPGYTLERTGRSEKDFVHQLVEAGHFLRARYGLEQGCLKASESGDGARITTGIDLADRSTLETLGREAHSHGDDYVLEAHIHYRRPKIAGQELLTALSAHVRGGRVAEGATLQFVEGTPWKGNVYVDESTVETFQVSRAHYRQLRNFMATFAGYFEERGGGLVLAGVDFAIGTVGGHFGDRPLLGVQDLNVSFTGAECLSAFLERARADTGDEQSYGVTRIVKPRLDGGDHDAFLRQTDRLKKNGVYADTIASIPGRWGMVGVAGSTPEKAMERLGELCDELRREGLVAA